MMTEAWAELRSAMSQQRWDGCGDSVEMRFGTRLARRQLREQELRSGYEGRNDKIEARLGVRQGWGYVDISNILFDQAD